MVVFGLYFAYAFHALMDDHRPLKRKLSCRDGDEQQQQQQQQPPPPPPPSPPPKKRREATETASSSYQQRKEAQSRKEYRNIKCALSSILCPTPNKRKLQQQIEGRVESVSKMAVKASLVLRAVFLEYYTGYEKNYKNQGEGVLPSFRNRTFVDQAFKIGAEMKTSKISEIMKTVWKLYFKGFQTEKRYPYDSNSIYIEAEKLQTRFFMLTDPDNLFEVQEKAIKKELKQKKKKEGPGIQACVRAIKYLILEGKRKYGGNVSGDEMDHLKDTHSKFIERQKEMMESKEFHEMTRLERILYLYRMEESNILGKTITIVPTNERKYRFMGIDNTVVEGLVDAAEKKKNKEKTDKKMTKEEMWTAVFNMEKIRDGSMAPNKKLRWRFDNFIATDGVSACVRYSREKPQQQQQQEQQQQKQQRVVVAGSTRRRVIGIDPGITNAAYCVELDEFDFQEQTFKYRVAKTCKLTSRQYYNDAKMTKLRNYTNRIYKDLSKKMSPGSEAAADASSKTLTEKLNSEIQRYVANYKEIWRIAALKNLRRLRFLVFMRKHSVIDKFIENMKKPANPSSSSSSSSLPPVVAYGAAYFKSSKRGCKYSAPNQFFYKKLVDKLGSENVILVDEFNTSRACPVNGKVALEKVVVKRTATGEQQQQQQQQQEIVTREIRGLRRCAHMHVIEEDNGGLVSHCNNSSSSRRGTFLSRDAVGAINIAKKLICDSLFNFKEPREKLHQRTYVLKNMGGQFCKSSQRLGGTSRL